MVTLQGFFNIHIKDLLLYHPMNPQNILKNCIFLFLRKTLLFTKKVLKNDKLHYVSYLNIRAYMFIIIMISNTVCIISRKYTLKEKLTENVNGNIINQF